LGLDPYTAVKSAERIADNLSQVVHTQDFITKVLRQDSSIDQSRLPTDPSKRRKSWQKTVRTSLVSGTGLLTVTALSEDKNEAVKIAQAIADVLSVSGKEYIGGDLEVKVVDTPLPSSYPISPNIPLAAAIGVVFGFAIGAFYVLWKEESRAGGGGAVN
jgi:capsular polysaccharide biosynthesis protein